VKAFTAWLADNTHAYLFPTLIFLFLEAFNWGGYFLFKDADLRASFREIGILTAQLYLAGIITTQVVSLWRYWPKEDADWKVQAVFNAFLLGIFMVCVWHYHR
jgi:hypothetical protein